MSDEWLGRAGEKMDRFASRWLIPLCVTSFAILAFGAVAIAVSVT